MELSDTKLKIIEAAEGEFATKGYAGASIRAITAAAGVNIAAINYHFGSKEDLFKAMARYRFEPINELRMNLLDILEERYAPNPPPLADVVEIIIRPLVSNFLVHGSQGCVFMRAMGKALSEERPFMQALQKEILKTIVGRISDLFRRIVPTATPAQLAYAMHLISCAIVGAMMQHSRLESIYGEVVDANDSDVISDNLVTFVSGGLTAVLETNPQSQP